MKINPFEIMKVVNKTMKNKDKYVAKVEELKANPPEATDGSATAIFDIDRNRIARISCRGVSEEALTEITNAVNKAFDTSEQFWDDMDKL